MEREAWGFFMVLGEVLSSQGNGRRLLTSSGLTFAQRRFIILKKAQIHLPRLGSHNRQPRSTDSFSLVTLPLWTGFLDSRTASGVGDYPKFKNRCPQSCRNSWSALVRPPWEPATRAQGHVLSGGHTSHLPASVTQPGFRVSCLCHEGDH